MYLAIPLLIMLAAACGEPPATIPDGGTDSVRAIDSPTLSGAHADATPPEGTCLTTGAGADGDQCCVWAADACGAGLSCVWTGSSQNTGVCLPPNRWASALGSDCQLYANGCEPGAYCLHETQGASGICRQLCRPAGGGPACSAGTACVDVAEEDHAVGACMPGGDA